MFLTGSPEEYAALLLIQGLGFRVWGGFDTRVFVSLDLRRLCRKCAGSIELRAMQKRYYRR